MRILLLFALLWAPGLASAQSSLSRAQAQKDAKALRTLVLKVHPSPDAYTSRDSLEAIFRNLTNFEGDSIARLAWEVRVREALLPIGCGHTYMARGNKMPKSRVVRLLPFSVFTRDNKIWVTGGIDSARTNVLPPGAEIVDIGGHKASTILARIKKHQPSDGYNMSFRERLSNRETFLNYSFAKFFSNDSVQRITWADNEGRLHYQSVATLTEKQVKTKSVQKDSTYIILHKTKNKLQQFYFHPQHDSIGVLDIRSFSGKNAKKFYAKAIEEMNRRKTPYLVIDLRDNTGGNYASSINLVRYLTNKRFNIVMHRRLFRSWRHQRWTNHLGRISAFLGFDVFYIGKKWLRKGKVYYKFKYKPSKKHQYNGQVFVLVNGMSFSASSQVTTFLKENSNAVIIGTETGGGAMALNGMQIPVFKLPESKILIHVPQMHIDNRLGPDKGQGVLPHIPTDYNIEDILAGRDLDWEAVLRKMNDEL